MHTHSKKRGRGVLNELEHRCVQTATCFCSTITYAFNMFEQHANNTVTVVVVVIVIVIVIVIVVVVVVVAGMHIYIYIHIRVWNFSVT